MATDPYPAPTYVSLHIDRADCSDYLKTASVGRLCVQNDVAMLVVGVDRKAYIHHGRLDCNVFKGDLKYCSLFGSDRNKITLSCYEEPRRLKRGEPDPTHERTAILTTDFVLGHVWMGRWKVLLLEPLAVRGWEPEWSVPDWDTVCDELHIEDGKVLFKTNGAVTKEWSLSTPKFDTRSFFASYRIDGNQSVKVQFVEHFDDFYHITLEARTGTAQTHFTGIGYNTIYKDTVKYHLIRLQ
jgi:hypothetical protein